MTKRRVRTPAASALTRSLGEDALALLQTFVAELTDKREWSARDFARVKAAAAAAAGEPRVAKRGPTALRADVARLVETTRGKPDELATRLYVLTGERVSFDPTHAHEGYPLHVDRDLDFVRDEGNPDRVAAYLLLRFGVEGGRRHTPGELQKDPGAKVLREVTKDVRDARTDARNARRRPKEKIAKRRRA